MTIFKRHCDECNKYYEGRGKKYCSRKCGKNGKLNPFYNKKYTKKTKEKLAKYRIGKSTGSREKHWNWKGGIENISKKCKDCGRKINFRSTYCYSCAKKGERSNNWRGGITPFRLKIWKSPEYQKWRQSIFERDNYTCQNCNKTKCWIEAHHIKSFAEFKKLRFKVSNGITLCKKCHKIFHKGIPKPKYS